MKITSQLKMVCAAAGVLSLLASGTAWAGWSTIVRKLTSVGIWDGAATYVEFTPAPVPTTGGPSCASTGRYQLVGSAVHVEAATKLATAAFLAGRPVSAKFNSTCVNGDGQVTDIVMQ